MARSNLSGKMREVAESTLPRDKALLLALGNVPKTRLTVLHSQVLVAGYIPSSRTKGGIFLTDKAVEEERWQGGCGLVIALGKGAFKDDHIAKFHGDKLKVGDWVMYLPADGVALAIMEVPCRLFQDSRILMKVDDPSLFY